MVYEGTGRNELGDRCLLDLELSACGLTHKKAIANRVAPEGGVGPEVSRGWEVNTLLNQKDNG